MKDRSWWEITKTLVLFDFDSDSFETLVACDYFPALLSNIFHQLSECYMEHSESPIPVLP